MYLNPGDIVATIEADELEAMLAAEGEEVPDDVDEEEAKAADDAGDDMARLVIRAHEDSVYCVAATPSQYPGEPLGLAGAGDDAWSLFALTDGEVLRREPDMGESVVACGFSHDGSQFAVGMMDGRIVVYTTATGEQCRVLEGLTEDLLWMAWHPRGSVLAAGASDATSWVWDTSNGDVLAVFSGHEGAVRAGTWSPSGKVLITSGADGTTKLWSVKTASCTHTFEKHGWHEAGAVAQAVHPDQPLLLVGGEDGTARLANVANKRVLATLPHISAGTAAAADTSDTLKSAVDDLAMATKRVPEGGAAAAAEAAAGARTADDASAGPSDEEGSEPDDTPRGCSVEGVAFSTVLPWVATGDTDGLLRVWDLSRDVAAGVTLRQQMQHPDSIIDVQWHPALPCVFTACADGVLRLWDARKGELLREYTGHTDMVLCMAMFSPTPEHEGIERLQLLSGGDDCTTRVFNL